MYTVTFSSPGTVGTKQTVTLTWDGEDLGGATWTETAGDSGAGGTFDEASLPGGDFSSGAPQVLTFHYTPGAAGTVTFNFSSDNGAVLYHYTPATLTVNAAGVTRGAAVGSAVNSGGACVGGPSVDVPSGTHLGR